MPEPEDMKTEDFNSDRFVRNMLGELGHYDDVYISREWAREDVVEWEVIIYIRNRRIQKKGEQLISVLWAALQETSEEYDKFYKDLEAKRKKALAKLNEEDMQALRIAR